MISATMVAMVTSLPGGCYFVSVCHINMCYLTERGDTYLLPRQHLCTLTYVMDYLAVFPHYHYHHVHTVDWEIFTLKIIRVKNFCVDIFSIREIFLTVNGYNMDE